MKGKKMSEHDMSGHCGAIIHVDGYTRNGNEVAAYDRQCGRDHNNDKMVVDNELLNLGESFENNDSSTLPESHKPTSNNMPMTTKYSNLITNYWPHLKQNEGFQQEGYLDTLGNITIGSGRMIENEDDFVALPLEVNGRPATLAEKQAEYTRLSDFKERGEYGKNYEAWKFQKTDKSKALVLPEIAMVEMVMEHLEWDLQELERKFPGFENYPRATQTVLLDMQYNMGNNFNERKWPKFYEGVRNKDIDKLVNEVNRPQVAPGRNDWARKILKEIPTINGWHFKD